MCQCLEGDKVDWENLRTPEQQAGMSALFGPMISGLQMGATQFPGQLSAPMTDMQKMAAKTQSGIGGFGWEQQSPKYKSVPPTEVPPLPFNFSGSSGSGSSGSGAGGGGGGGIGPGPGPDPYIPPGPGPTPPGPGPGPDPDPKPDIIQAMLAQNPSMLLQLLGMGGSPYDPRNMMG